MLVVVVYMFKLQLKYGARNVGIGHRLIGGLGGWLSDGLSSRLGDKLGTGFNSRRGGRLVFGGWLSDGLNSRLDADRLQVVPLDEAEKNQCIRLLSFCKRHSPNRSIERVAPDERMGQLPSHQSDILLFFQDVCRLMQAIKDHGRVRSDGARRSRGCVWKRDNDIANGALQVVLADPGVLDCSICHEPLCTPVFQYMCMTDLPEEGKKSKCISLWKFVQTVRMVIWHAAGAAPRLRQSVLSAIHLVINIPVTECEKGHLSCFSCCSEMKKLCPLCYTSIGCYGYNHNRGLENIIDTAIIPCKNAKRGCKLRMHLRYHSEHEHQCNEGIDSSRVNQRDLSLSVCIKKKVISSEFEEMEKVTIDEYPNLKGRLKVMLTNLDMFYCSSHGAALSSSVRKDIYHALRAALR
ncbi:histone-lysine N-methyltransferase ATX2-like protein isoform X1 [Tanacetum coccineum]